MASKAIAGVPQSFSASGKWAMTHELTISGNIVDVCNQRIFPGSLVVRDGRIAAVHEEHTTQRTYLLPGFVDAHVHIESSMLPPAEFARAAVRHGTVATVSDPHEIANVLGVPGIQFMLDDSARSPCKIAFGAPSCVPATPFETAGAALELAEIDALLALPDVRCLSEMMNYPAVIQRDPRVMAFLAAARRHGKPVDGHAPGIRGEALRAYIDAGITTDHEVTTLEEARERIALGMCVLIREGSAARDSAELLPLIAESPAACMFCSDDLHPDDLLRGHIDRQVRAACRQGIDVMRVLRCACVNPVRHYGLDVGLLRPGDAADFIEVNNLEAFQVLSTYLGGQCVARDGESLLPHMPIAPINAFAAHPCAPSDFAVTPAGSRMRVITVADRQLLTGMDCRLPVVRGGHAVADSRRDLLKVVVINRYRPAPPAVGFVAGIGLRRGAFASSVAHDSHNIVAVGASEGALCAAVNAVIAMRGGLAVADGHRVETLPLPLAGLMSDDAYPVVARRYAELDGRVKALGSALQAPFMTLSFLALLVIPRLKIGDRGLFDGETFSPVNLFHEDGHHACTHE